MADWTDGAEYAPLERPVGFATPRAGALPEAERDPNPADGRPSQPPQAWDEPREALPLASLVPAARPTRDPSEPFHEDATPDTLWGQVHAPAPSSWDPRQPLAEPAPVAGLGSGGVAALPAPTGAPAVAVAAPVSPTGAGNPALAFPPPQGPPVAPGPVGPWQAVGTPPAQVAPGHGAPARIAPGQPAPIRNPFLPAGQQQAAPVPWSAPQAATPQRPLPQHLDAATVLRESGWLVLALLVVGAAVPWLAYITLVVASMVSQRNPFSVKARPLFRVATTVTLLAVVASMFVGDYSLAEGVGRWCSILMAPAVVIATRLELAQRMGR